MKKLRKTAAVAAALTLLTVSSASVYAENAASVYKADIAYKAQTTADTQEKETKNTYVKPMTTNRKSKKYKDFVSAKPVISAERSYYGAAIKWTPVENALLYYIYKVDGSKRTLVAKTADTSYYTYNYGTYIVRAVTYDYNDKRIMSKKSDKFVLKDERPPYYYDDNDDEDGSYYADEEVNDAADAGFAVTDASSSSLNTISGLSVSSDERESISPDEEYSHYDVDGFKNAAQTPLSTFSADVDTASYANVRRMANDNYKVPADAVRIEEMLNYFDYNYSLPKDKRFSVTYEYSDCPWNKDAKLLMFGVQAKDIKTEPNSNLVFLVDVSGSMYSKDKLPLVKESLKKLSNELTAKDRISIVTYSGMEKVLISGARGNMVNCISELADTMDASGCTNGEAGINMAYDIAQQNYIKDGSNRVILATDGDLNVGISDKDELSKFIADKRATGVYLTVLGFGMGNIKDNKMEALAKDGNGNYYYIDCATEAQKVLVNERKQTLITIADDVKLQVEFNPTLVDSYKLIGYDGRKLNNEDFTNDKKDAADMGAGQSVTVMYEIIPASGKSETLAYQSANGNKTDICTLKIRYKKPGEEKSRQSKFIVKAADYKKYKKTDIRFKFATCVTEAAMALKNETTYGSVSLRNAKDRLDAIDPNELKVIGYSDDFGYVLDELMTDDDLTIEDFQ